MKKLSIIALTLGALALTATALFKIFGKKRSCSSGYDDEEFDDEFDDYDFDSCDCCKDDLIPADESDETVEVKVEQSEETAENEVTGNDETSENTESAETTETAEPETTEDKIEE